MQSLQLLILLSVIFKVISVAIQLHVYLKDDYVSLLKYLLLLFIFFLFFFRLVISYHDYQPFIQIISYHDYQLFIQIISNLALDIPLVVVGYDIYIDICGCFSALFIISLWLVSLHTLATTVCFRASTCCQWLLAYYYNQLPGPVGLSNIGPGLYLDGVTILVCQFLLIVLQMRL